MVQPQSPASRTKAAAFVEAPVICEEIELIPGQNRCMGTPVSRMVGLALGVWVMVVLSGCSTGSGLTRHEFMRRAMGGQAQIVLYSETREAAVEASRAAFDRIEELDGVMSDYRADSELMRLCAQAGSGPMPASVDLIEVLGRGEEISRASDGAFDVTVGPIVQLWRRARGDGRLPKSDELAGAMRLVGWEKVRLDGDAGTVDLAMVGMRLDLGGIGKGFAADAAFEQLRIRGIGRCLVNIGGDIRVGDPPPGRAGWRIVPVPHSDGRRGEAMIVSNVGVASSGDAERFVEVDGVRYSHIVDPRTGIGLTHRTAVTVIARDATAADALASAASVLGPDRGRALVKLFGASVEFERFVAKNK